MRSTRSILLLAVVLRAILTATPLVAHHSFAAEYDANKPVTLKGVVTKIQFLLQRETSQGYEMLETACHEDNRDLAHLKAAYDKGIK